MAKYEPLETADGSIAFEGTVRHVEEYGANVFWIKLPSRPLLYGEWRMVFASNGNDYDIQIRSFGYPDKMTVSNGHYVMLNESERDAAKRLINLLFTDRIRTKIYLLNIGKSRFLGDIRFKSGWTVIESEYRSAIKARS